MEVEQEAGLGGDCFGHKRPDPERGADGSDVKRPRDGNDHLDHSSKEMEDSDDEEYWPPIPNPLDACRQNWTATFGRRGGSFEDETEIPPMRYTNVPVLPPHVWPIQTMQVFSVKVTQITDALHWPLDVYGFVAVRDSADHKRNFIFRRGRDECQTLTSLQDSLLELRGPSRAIILMDPPSFEIDLKIKGKGSPSEDMALSYNAFIYQNIAHYAEASYAITKEVPSEHSTMEVRFAHLAPSVEATVTISVIRGSSGFRARFTARTASIDDDVVLLDSQGGKVPVAGDGQVMLLRHVLVVEENGELIISVEAGRCDVAAESVVSRIKVPARSALCSEGYLDVGFSRMRVFIAWSMFP